MSNNRTKTTWRTLNLGDLFDLKYGYGLTMQSRTHGKVPVYGSSGVVGFHNEAVVDRPGIIIGRKGNVGAVHYSESPFYPIDTVYFIDETKQKSDLRFLYYLLSKVPFKRIGSDVGVPGLNRDLAYQLEVSIPEDVNEQKRIAEILSAFDEKIENNNHIIKTLEEMAQAIFKEWFVVNPGNTKEVPLTEMADFVNGGAFGRIINHEHKGLPLVKIAEFSRGVTEKTDWINEEVPQKYLIKDGDLLFSWSGSLELHIWHKGKAVLNQHLFNVIPKDTYTKGLLYVVLRSVLPWFKQIAQSKATSMGHIQRHHLEEQIITIPKGKDFDVFEVIYRKIITTMVENQKLTAMRDLLLPHLMSGEIRV